MSTYRKFLFLFLFLPSLSAFPLNNDTTKVIDKTFLTEWFTANQFDYDDSVNQIDQSLYDYQKYSSKNILGNIGQPLQEIEYQPYKTPLGFVYSINHSADYFYSPANLKFYNTRTPYTDVFYVIGTKREQLFKGTFSYNVKKNWNITADFSRIRSEGVYLRQNTNDNFIALSTNYKSKSNRYWLLTSIIYNSLKNSENGGISSDSTFRDGGNIDEKLLNVNLNSAKRSTENANVYIKQILNFGPKSNDSTSQNLIIPWSRLILISSVVGNSCNYQDDNPTSGYYSTIIYDSTQTFDSTFYSKIENDLSWKKLDNKKHRGFIDIIGFGAGFKHQFINLHQRTFDTSFYNLIGRAEIFNAYSMHSFYWNYAMDYILGGYNKGDYHSIINFKKNSQDNLNSIGLKIESRLQNPDYIYNKFISNHFLWDNHFSKSQGNGVEISFEMKKIKFEISGGFYNYKNILYFDNFAVPRQYKGVLPLVSAFLRKDFILFNWHLNNKFTYQYVPDSSVIRLPQFISENSFYYENYLLKKALLIEVGASLYYTTAYYSNAYMPVSGQFYLQNNKQYGNYPFIDFFVNAKIKTVRIFFKIDHLNSGWGKRTYILTPGYPYPERTFKIGISWKFFD
jgi:hypothetical protein